MYLMYELNETGDRIYTLKVNDWKLLTKSQETEYLLIFRKAVQMVNQQFRHILVRH